MRIRCAKLKSEGTSLVDVLMATALVAIMATGLVGSLTYGFWTMGNARENQRATQVILEKLESIRLYSWDQWHSNNFVPPTFTDVYDPQTTNSGLVYYGTIETNSVDLGSSVNSNMFQVTISVRWTNREVSHVRSVFTYIAKNGIQNYVY